MCCLQRLDPDKDIEVFKLDPNYESIRPESGKSDTLSPTPELKGRVVSAEQDGNKRRVSDKSPAIKTLDLPLQPLVSRGSSVHAIRVVNAAFYL